MFSRMKGLEDAKQLLIYRVHADQRPNARPGQDRRLPRAMLLATSPQHGDVCRSCHVDSQLLDGDSQLDRVVRCVNQILFRPEIPFSRLHRGVTEEHLDLLKFAASRAA